MSDGLGRKGTFKRFVRTLSLSRSQAKLRQKSPVEGAVPLAGDVPPVDAAETTGPVPVEVPGRNRKPEQERVKTNDHGLSSSPAPESYFPRAPKAVWRDTEASGTARHPESVGERAADVGVSAQGAPGVSFAPSRDPRVLEDPNTFVMAPRRSHSVVRNNSPAGRAHSRSRSAAVQNQGEVMVGSRAVPVGERRGVQLEDKVLTRGTSIRRAASVVKRAVEKVGFVQTDKVPGEVRVLLLVADGSEEIEFAAPYDIFVRAGMTAVVASISPPFSPSESLPYITLSRGLKVLADTQFETLKQEYKDDFDAVVIPGGAKGAERLASDPEVITLIQQFYDSGKTVAMICAGPALAKTAGIGIGKAITSHPSVKKDLAEYYDFVDNADVVVADNLITSRGPASAITFGLTVVEHMLGAAKKNEIAEQLTVLEA